MHRKYRTLERPEGEDEISAGLDAMEEDSDFQCDDLLFANAPLMTFPTSAVRDDPPPAKSLPASTNRHATQPPRAFRRRKRSSALKILLDNSPQSISATHSNPYYLRTPPYETEHPISLTDATFQTSHPFIASYICLTSTFPRHLVLPTPHPSSLLWTLLALVLWSQPMHPAYWTFWRPGIAKYTADSLLGYMDQDWKQIVTRPENYYVWLLNNYRPVFLERMMKEVWFNPEAGLGRKKMAGKKKESEGVSTRAGTKRKSLEEECEGRLNATAAAEEGPVGKKAKVESPRKRGRPCKAVAAARAAESLGSTSPGKRSPRDPPPEATRRSTRHKHVTERAGHQPPTPSPPPPPPSPPPVSPCTTTIPPAIHIKTSTFTFRNRAGSSASSSTAVRSPSSQGSSSSVSTLIAAPDPVGDKGKAKAADVDVDPPERITRTSTRNRGQIVDVLQSITALSRRTRRRVPGVAPYPKDKEEQIASGRGRRGIKVEVVDEEPKEVGKTMRRPGRPRKGRRKT